MQAVVVRGTDSFITLLLHEGGLAVPSDDITRCDIVLRRLGVADIKVSSADLPDLFVLQHPHVYGGRQLNVVRINLMALEEPPPDGRCEGVVLLFDAEHPNGEFCGVVGIEFVAGHLEVEGGGAEAPTITTLDPDTVFEGFGPETITVNGTNFVLGSVVQFEGSPRTTNFISATELEVTLDATDTETIGAFDLQVSNFGTLSNTATLTVEELGSPLNLTNRTISRAGQAIFSLGNDASGQAASGGNSVTETFFADEWLIGWPSSPVNPADYEVRWSTISGTLDSPPTDDGFNPLPENTWSFNEWGSALPIYDSSFRWVFGFLSGPPWQKTSIGTCIIQVEIRRIDMTDGPISAQITLTRSS